MLTAYRTLFGIVAVISVFATAAWERNGKVNRSIHTAAADPEPGDNILTDVWETPLPIPGFRSASISDNGAFIATVSTDRHIICVRHQNGRVIWRKPNPGVTNADISSDGKTLIAYSPLDPTPAGNIITIYQGLHGESVSKFPLDGAIWNVQISSDSQTAIITTGGHTLYSLNLNGRPAGRRWSLPGIGNSISMTKDGRYIALGTWDQSGVYLYDAKPDPPVPPIDEPKPSKGKSKPPSEILIWPWTSSDTRNRLFEVQIARDAKYILGISYANFNRTNPKVYLWKFDRTPQWKEPLDLGADASSPTAVITANGRYVVLSYVSTVSHGDQVLETKHLIVYNRVGRQVLYLPGFLFSPTLVATSPDGSNVVISDGSSKLYTVSIDGRMSSPRALPAPIQQTIVSDDGHFVLIYTIDGNLNLMRLG